MRVVEVRLDTPERIYLAETLEFLVRNPHELTESGLRLREKLLVIVKSLWTGPGEELIEIK